MTDLETVHLLAATDWRKAQEVVERIIVERNQEELPERIQRVRVVVKRFRSQIEASGGDPEDLVRRQETDLMRAGVYTNPMFMVR